MDRSGKVLDWLRRYESRNVTFMEGDGSWPIVWEQAKGVEVKDAEGRVYLDLTAAFGVAAAGHANTKVVRAGRQQMGRLLHAMGDVHPHALKARLARELSRLTFERWTRRAGGSGQNGHGKTIFSNSGFEAVEAALKTARLATGKPGIIVFSGAYHGLGYGTLNATHRPLFRSPFTDQLGGFGHFAEFPSRNRDLPVLAKVLRGLFDRHRIGAVLVEPVQGRAGIRVPPAGFLPLLRRCCNAQQACLILDEVYTGFGRTGRWFACEHWNVIPDLICLGKALTGGFPLSACVGRASLMDAAWPKSQGEAIHTSTFLGHPVGCAMALANLEEIRDRRLPEKSASQGRFLLEELRALLKTVVLPLRVAVRGLGLMVGIELTRPQGKAAAAETLQVVKTMLGRGYILLPEGEFGNVVSLTPPLIIDRASLKRCLGDLVPILAQLESR